MSRLGVMVNPTAGLGRGVRTGRLVHAALRAAGHVVTDLSAPTLAQATDRARGASLQNLDGLVVVGGDGAVHLAVNVVAGTGLPLGIVPAGSGNDIARSLGVPRRVPEALAQIDRALHAAPRSIDAVEVGAPDREAVEWFVGVLSCGLDAAVNARANAYGWPKGHARYVRAVAAELPRFRPYGYRVTLDDGTWVSAGTLVAAANTPWFGGGLRIAPGAVLDDGLLDVVVAGPFSRAGTAGIFHRLYAGTHLGHPLIEVHRSRSVVIEHEPALGGHPPVAFADGERIGPLPLRARVVPGALQILV